MREPYAARQDSDFLEATTVRMVIVRGRFGRIIYRGGADWTLRDGALIVVGRPIREMEALDKLKTFNKGAWRSVEFKEV